MSVKDRLAKAEKAADQQGLGCTCTKIPIIEVYDGEPAPALPPRPRCAVHPARPGVIVVDFIEVLMPRPAAERE